MAKRTKHKKTNRGVPSGHACRGRWAKTAVASLAIVALGYASFLLLSSLNRSPQGSDVRSPSATNLKIPRSIADLLALNPAEAEGFDVG